MSSIGKNMKWTMSSTLRDRLRTFFEEGLQAKRVKEDVALDAFAFAAGSSIGIEYVEGGKALSAERRWKARSPGGAAFATGGRWPSSAPSRWWRRRTAQG